jgi:nucleoside-diphosphate-sugar epimerase
MIATNDQLEDVLSKPNEHDVEALKEMEGDLILLGAGGKMGPSLAARARRAAVEGGVKKRIIAVSRYSSPESRREIEEAGVEVIPADLLNEDDLAQLPLVDNVIFMVGRKFGSTGAESLTWAMNAYVPARVAEHYRSSRIVAFSSGNIYPLVPVTSGGATEQSPLVPMGEYAQSVLARERMFEYMSSRYQTPMAILRLNYAIDLRYGVLLDIGRKVFERRPVDLATGNVNVIWQGDANSVCLRSFAHCSSPPMVLNLTGPETLSVRWIARRFGELLGIDPQFEGTEAPTALLNNASRCQRLFGYPTVSAEQMIEWTAAWIRGGGAMLDKPTHFETRDGKF